MQSAQNKCIRFYLNLKNTTHVGATEFKAINWLPTKNRVDQDTCVNIMKFFKGMAPAYADEMFQSADQSRVTRRSKFKLNPPFRKSSAGQKCLSYLGPKIWNTLSSDLKSTNSINSFKHMIKDNFFQNIQREEKAYIWNRASSLIFMFQPYHIYDLYKSTYKFKVYYLFQSPLRGPLWK